MKKWSYKYKQCIKCWTTEKKHSAKWLCTVCYHQNINSKKPKEERLQSIQKIQNWRKNNPDKIKIINRNSYIKNQRAIYLLKKARRRISKGKPCMQANLWWKLRNLPFESLERPSTYGQTDNAYEKWKQNMKNFEIIRNYYEKD